MTVFDLLLDYVAYADHSLRAREYGVLLSSLVVDRQSRAFLAGRLLRAKEDWRRRQNGFQKYLNLDSEGSIFLERLSLHPVALPEPALVPPPRERPMDLGAALDDRRAELDAQRAARVRWATEARGLEEMTRKVAEAFEDACQYARRCSRRKWVLRCVDTDRRAATLWLGAWALYHDALAAKVNERFVKYVWAEVQAIQRNLESANTYTHQACRTTPEELARCEREYRDGLIVRAMGYELALLQPSSLPDW